MVEIRGDYITRYTRLQYEVFKNRVVEISDETAGHLRFTRFAEIAIGERKIRPKLLSVAVNQLTFNVPESAAGMEQGNKLNCKFYLQFG